MVKWKCTICGHIYDEESGDPSQNVPPNTTFDNLPNDWICPICGAEKSMFRIVEEISFGKKR